MRRLAFLALACGLFGTVAGCVVYDPGLVSNNSQCGRRPPARPDIPDTEEPGEVSFGLRDVVLNQDEQWREIGYDLDCITTTSDQPQSECTPPLRGSVPFDGVEGIDNQFGVSLYPLVENVVPGLETRAREAQLAGNGLPVLRIRRWNRTPNDPLVDITITAAVFSGSGPGDTAPEVEIRGPTDYSLVGGAPLPGPTWDGDDWTWVRDDSFLAGDPDSPLVRDPRAYVVDGVIVASLPAGVDIVFPTDDVGVLVRLTGAVATSRISEDGLQLENVIVAGRWSITDLLSTAENVGVCRSDPRYGFLDMQLRRTSDVLRQPPAPGDPMVECDAMSLGVRFTGFRMRIAGVTEGLPINNVCGSIDGGMSGDGAMSMDAGIDASEVDAAMESDAGVDASDHDADDHDADDHDAGTDAG